MNWKFVKNKPHLQVDEVGNIVQESGAVKTKACQKCKAKFDYTPTEIAINQPVAIYECENCDFINGGSEATLDHKITTDHKIKRTIRNRVVGYEKRILGNTAHIKTLEDDIEILCGDCVGI